MLKASLVCTATLYIHLTSSQDYGGGSYYNPYNPYIDPVSTTTAPPEPIVTTADTCCSCTEQGTCEDTVCQDLLCSTYDPLCCDAGEQQFGGRRGGAQFGWGPFCADAAKSICSTTSTCCGCTVPWEQGSGCPTGDDACSTTVCETDPWCCNTENGQWDNLCANMASSVCSGEALPSCCQCTSSSTSTGCEIDPICEAAVCAEDSFCCGTGEIEQTSRFSPLPHWDQGCAQRAADFCGGEPIPTQLPEEFVGVDPVNPIDPIPEQLPEVLPEQGIPPINEALPVEPLPVIPGANNEPLPEILNEPPIGDGIAQ